jgi:hypothetical protein
VYDIFINSFQEKNTANYSITAVAKGQLTVTGAKYNIKFRGVSNGKVTALIRELGFKGAELYYRL